MVPVVAYVRTVRTASEARAVQIVYSQRRGSRVIEHIESAHTDADCELLKGAARRKIVAGQGELDLRLPGSPANQSDPVAAASHGVVDRTSKLMESDSNGIRWVDIGFLLARYVVQPRSAYHHMISVTRIRSVRPAIPVSCPAAVGVNVAKNRTVSATVSTAEMMSHRPVLRQVGEWRRAAPVTAKRS